MKNTLKGLSLQITKSKIIVTDTTGIKQYNKTYKKEFILTDINKLEMLGEAKSWLWNMGCYNGQANELMQKHNQDWIKELK